MLFFSDFQASFLFYWPNCASYLTGLCCAVLVVLCSILDENLSREPGKGGECYNITINASCVCVCVCAAVSRYWVWCTAEDFMILGR